MLRSTSLFERICMVEEGKCSNVQGSNEVAESIMRNLKACLNSHIGGTPTRMDWGLTFVKDMTLTAYEISQKLRVEIKHQLEAFEPRLKRVVVHHQPDREASMNVCFRIEAELAGENSGKWLAINTRVLSNGTVEFE